MVLFSGHGSSSETICGRGIITGGAGEGLRESMASFASRRKSPIGPMSEESIDSALNVIQQSLLRRDFQLLGLTRAEHFTAYQVVCRYSTKSGDRVGKLKQSHVERYLTCDRHHYQCKGALSSGMIISWIRHAIHALCSRADTGSLYWYGNSKGCVNGR